MQILINRDGQQLGPYTLEQVNEYLAAGSLSPDDPAWHEGLAEWVALNQVGGIVVPAASAPPPFDPDAFGASPPPPGTPSPEPNQPPSASSPPVAMGTICPQCSVAVQPGQVVCMNCGSHLHAIPTAGKKGAGKLIAIIGGSVLVLALLVGGLFLFVIKGDLLGNNKKKREQCVNNIGNVYKAGLAFAQDNGERLPWQLTASGVRIHLDNSAMASTQVSGRYFGQEINVGANGDNSVQNHPYTDSAAGVYGIIGMKAELVTPKILHSPCDSDRADANELVQENWSSYDTKARGVSAELGAGVSYVLVRGADTRRPSAVYALTRNWSDDQLNTGEWLGSDSDPGNARTIAGLNASQGQCVTMDGGAMQSTNADCGVSGTYTKAAQTATGGVCRGRTSLKLIRGPGL